MRARDTPRGGSAPDFLFQLELEDGEHCAVSGLSSGPDASALLPGRPTPAEFASNPEARQRVMVALEKLESVDGEGKPNGPLLRFRLRSYVSRMRNSTGESGKRNAQLCKRYSIIAPSSLDPQA